MSTVTAPATYREALERAIADVVAPNASRVDRDGVFPRESIDALASAGVLGLLSASDVGGAGLGLREAAEVIERLAGACGSTAMIVLMHFAAVQVLEAHAPEEVRRRGRRGTAPEHPRLFRGRLAQPFLGATGQRHARG